MKFGKLTDISQVDFRLPPDADGTAATLRRFHRPGEPLGAYIGATGWSMKEWVGRVYPRGTKAAEYLRQYALQFNTVELNSTHYRIPAPELVSRWHRETTADFRFCPKLPQSISHSRPLGGDVTLVSSFAESIGYFGEKLGCCFIQLPPYFGADRLEELRGFLTRWPNHLPLAVEFRHPSWFGRRRQEAFGMMTDLGISTVITDVAGRRDVLHMRLTTSTTMIRFVGNGLDPTDYHRIDDWVERLDRWRELGLSTVFFFTHEPDNVQAPELARYLSQRLGSLPQTKVRGPRFDDENRQMSLF